MLTTNSLRQRVYDRMADEWGLKYNIHLTRLLARLVGRPVIEGEAPFKVDMTEHEIVECEKLLGPHGYAYFKMRMAQLGEDHG